MRLSRKRGRRLQECRLSEEPKEPMFPRVRRMTRKRSRRLRERLAKLAPFQPAFPHVLRMTRQRKRQQREREELKRGASQTAAASLGSVYLLQSAGAQAASLNTFHDVPSYFDYMRNARDRIRYHREAEENAVQARQWKEQAQKDLAEAEESVRQAEEGLRVAEQYADDCEKQLSRAKVALARAQDASEMATQTAVASQQDVADFLPQVYAQQAEVDALAAEAASREAEYLAQAQQGAAAVTAQDGANTAKGLSPAGAARAELIERTWQSVDYAQNQLPYVQSVVDGTVLPEGAAASASSEAPAVAVEASAYETRMDDASQAADEAQAVLDGLEEYLDVLQQRQDDAEAAEADARQFVIDMEEEKVQAEEEIRQARQTVEEAQKWLEDARSWQQQARASLAQSEKEQQQAEYALDHFGEGHDFALGMEYYKWQGSQSGHQLYVPLEISGEEHGWNWAVETGWVQSSSGQPQGSVSGWTDTIVSASLLDKHDKLDLRYKLTVNIPTGQAPVHEAANLPNDLARFTTFGEGLNFTPEIDATHHISERDSITARLSWAWRGNYDSLYTVVNDDGTTETRRGTQHPSNLWKQEAEYLHAGKHQQLLALMTHQSGGHGVDVRGVGYKENNEWSWKLFYNEDVSPKDSWQVYGAFALDKGTLGNVRRFNYGIGWRHEEKPGEVWWAMLTYMKTKGREYDFASGLDQGDRNRSSLQVGYDKRLDENSLLRWNLEYYRLRYATGTHYRGWGTSVMYYRSF